MGNNETKEDAFALNDKQEGEELEKKQVEVDIEESQSVVQPDCDSLHEEQATISEKQSNKDEKISDCLLSIASTISSMNEDISRLSDLFDKKILYSEHEKTLVDELVGENKLLKDNLYRKIVTPLLKSIIEIRNSMIRQVAYQKGRGEDIINLELFESYTIDMLNVLDKYDIEEFSSLEGDKLNLSLHEIIAKTETENEALDKTICKSIVPGYKRMNDGSVVLKEKVNVMILKK